jgi:hypothetical protein
MNQLHRDLEKHIIKSNRTEMKYFKLFEQFVTENNQPVNEATKWNKQEFEDLNKFAKKLSKVDPKEFDPAAYRGVYSAVINLKNITDSIYMMGDDVWSLQNKDKCRPIKWDGSSWIEATPEEADKGASTTDEYVKACEAVFQEGLKAIQLVEKGAGEKLMSILPKLEADTDKLYKMNKKWQKTRNIGTWGSNREYSDEKMKFRDEFAVKCLTMYQKATSNKEAIDEIQKRVSNF